MNDTHPRPAASQVGAKGNLLRQCREIPFGSENNGSNTSRGKESIVQKLQGVIFAVRRDRDREHRSLDIALEKFRSAKEVFQAEKLNFEAEKEKLVKTRNESERTQKEILRKEEIIQQLQQKYRFQHEDLIRKREKIQQQNSSLEAIAFHRNKCVLDARRRLDRQRNTYQELKRKHDQESQNLLSTIMHLAGEKNKTRTLHEANDIAIADIQAENGANKNAVDKEKSRSNDNDLDRFLESLEKKQEEALIREFKTNIDYDMLPKMISQKAQALKAETENIRAEITQLEAMLYGPANGNYIQEQERIFDDGKIVASNATFAANVGNGITG